MRGRTIPTLVAAMLASAAIGAMTPAQADYAAYGNDTGGIIPWSPAVDGHFEQTAAAHCAAYNKIAIIYSVKRRIGDYVGFRCLFPREYDPVKATVYGNPYLMQQLGVRYR